MHCQGLQSNRDKREVHWRYAAGMGMVPQWERSLHGLGVGLEEEHSSSHYDAAVVQEEAHSAHVRMLVQS